MEKCAADLFYGTDYQSHLGTRRGGMASYSKEKGFYRAIHNLESTYFRTRFEAELSKFEGESGIGIISDTDAQPMLFNSHLGRFAIVTVAKINNMEEIASKLLDENMYLSEFSSGKINPTELIGVLIVQGKTFVEGIENVFQVVADGGWHHCCPRCLGTYTYHHWQEGGRDGCYQREHGIP